MSQEDRLIDLRLIKHLIGRAQRWLVMEWQLRLTSLEA
jgi:hypothetical protein